MALRFHTLDVFTARAFGGNPLAVVLGGEALDTARMRAIAREFNLSETVFVLPATQAGARARLRIFTPLAELPFAGHPLVGTAVLLHALDGLPQDADLAFDVGIGRVPLHVRRDAIAHHAEFTLTQPPRIADTPTSSDTLATLLGLRGNDVDGGAHVVSCGLPALLVRLSAPELLAGIEPRMEGLRALLDALGARCVYAYARSHENDTHWQARMFMPGIGEDPATGSAAAALAALLAHQAGEAHARFDWTVHQGLEMNRPSRIHIAAECASGAIAAIRVGGHAVRVMEGSLHAH